VDVLEARASLQGAQRVAVLTGAGISKQSGIPTFREAQTGLWARFSPEELASPTAFRRDPKLVWEWYAWRYRLCAETTPNPAHTALAQLEAQRAQHQPEQGLVDGFVLVTQNVDGLHARAGSRRVIELHGNLARARCESCGLRMDLPAPDDLKLPPVCPRCVAPMRPDVVWFGELLPEAALQVAWDAFQGCQVALVIGTSGLVEPAASLGRLAQAHGAKLIEVNPSETPQSHRADLFLQTDAVNGLALLLETEG
jgi:NAD-dependent deacetylase